MEIWPLQADPQLHWSCDAVLWSSLSASLLEADLGDHLVVITVGLLDQRLYNLRAEALLQARDGALLPCSSKWSCPRSWRGRPWLEPAVRRRFRRRWWRTQLLFPFHVQGLLCKV